MPLVWLLHPSCCLRPKTFPVQYLFLANASIGEGDYNSTHHARILDIIARILDPFRYKKCIFENLGGEKSQEIDFPHLVPLRRAGLIVF